ncbi:hypothetical protein FB451DRAFT_1190196 [Mycena latifolia]|nr:hypothetical protein FB451DRAFT_1190196 [Mycena latifolia]
MSPIDRSRRRYIPIPAAASAISGEYTKLRIFSHLSFWPPDVKYQCPRCDVKLSLNVLHSPLNARANDASRFRPLAAPSRGNTRNPLSARAAQFRSLEAPSRRTTRKCAFSVISVWHQDANPSNAFAGNTFQFRLLQVHLGVIHQNAHFQSSPLLAPRCEVGCSSYDVQLSIVIPLSIRALTPTICPNFGPSKHHLGETPENMHFRSFELLAPTCKPIERLASDTSNSASAISGEYTKMRIFSHLSF